MLDNITEALTDCTQIYVVRCACSAESIISCCVENSPDLLALCSIELSADDIECITDYLSTCGKRPCVYDMFSFEVSENASKLVCCDNDFYVSLMNNAGSIARHIRQICTMIPYNRNRVELAMKKDIYHLLRELSVNPSRDGCTYIADSVRLMTDHAIDYLGAIPLEQIYDCIASKHNTNVSHIKRAISSSIATSWKHAEEQVKTKYFNTKVLDKPPTNKEYIYALTDNILKKYRFELMKQNNYTE
ncbi:MAG: hypothetical protein IJ129_02980 [Ruminococcus sp.]|nr:hypothetical protein [Ruminococcus sp.]